MVLSTDLALESSFEGHFELDHGIFVRSYPGSPRGGDMGLVMPTLKGVLVALLDAAGHGLEAYAVAQKARQVLLENAHLSPADLLRAIDHKLQGSIGAAAAVAKLEADQLAFCGIGNVNGRLIVGAHQQPLKVKVGVLGWRMRTPETQWVDFSHNACLVLHTDGVTLPERVNRGGAQAMAQALVEQHGSFHDDASVLVLQRQSKVV